MAANTFYHFDGNPADERAWQAFVAAHSDSSSVEQKQTSTTASTRVVYEVFILIIVIGALAAAILWQKTEDRLAQLEAEIQILQDKMSVADNLLDVKTTSVDVGAESTKPPVLHVIEADFLRFMVESGNMAAVSPIAFKIDRDYQQLCADLGIDPLSGQEKLMVYVTDNTNGRNPNPYAELVGITLDVSAYAQRATIGASDRTQLLYNELMGQLARRSLDGALSDRQVKLQWNTVIDYLYHHLTQSQLPKPVEDLYTYELARRHFAQTLAPNAAQLRYEPGAWMYPDHDLANTVADPLVEYILVTYGRESIPQLLDALSAYDDWEEIAPAVFSIAADQFTAEWHAYLQQHYPLEPIHGY
ncbi:MAG: hypothetical protein R3C14_42550 [Caldilineaceae bacterium]